MWRKPGEGIAGKVAPSPTAGLILSPWFPLPMRGTRGPESERGLDSCFLIQNSSFALRFALMTRRSERFS